MQKNIDENGCIHLQYSFHSYFFISPDVSRDRTKEDLGLKCPLRHRDKTPDLILARTKQHTDYPYMKAVVCANERQ